MTKVMDCFTLRAFDAGSHDGNEALTFKGAGDRRTVKPVTARAYKRGFIEAEIGSIVYPNFINFSAICSAADIQFRVVDQYVVIYPVFAMRGCLTIQDSKVLFFRILKSVNFDWPTVSDDGCGDNRVMKTIV